MKVLLISANTEQINMPVLPMGLACVAESVQRAGHEVEPVNLMAKPQSRSSITEAMQEFQPEVIGISVRVIDDQLATFDHFERNERDREQQRVTHGLRKDHLVQRQKKGPGMKNRFIAD